jgi:hypothetical protein
MFLDITKSVEIIEVMENYISRVRPPQEIRNQVDLAYEIEDQSIILSEIRPALPDPDRIITRGYAKATFVHQQNIWKLYWKRADNKWHSCKPSPKADCLEDILKIVDEDKHFCFKG